MSEILIKKAKFTTDWSNKDNLAIYEAMPTDELRNMAELLGISNGQDVDIIKDYVQFSKQILEVGAGYGRVVKKILELNPSVSLTAIERELKQFNLLQQNFPVPNIVYGDILDTEISASFDLVLVMWSTFGEFSKAEQKKLFLLLAGLLNQSGRIVIELTALSEAHPFAEVKQQDYMVRSRYGFNHIYIPTKEELEHISNSADMRLEDERELVVAQGSKRSFFIFQKH